MLINERNFRLEYDYILVYSLKGLCDIEMACQIAKQISC